MGAGQSDLYSGTYGDRIRNISKESTEGNIKDWLSKKQDADVYDSYNFTVAQKNSMTRIKNTIEHNLTEEDFSGTRRDLENSPVPNGRGGYYDHLKEMRQSLTALIKSAKSLEGTLQNPYLSENERQIIKDSLNMANDYINRITDLFTEYGYGGQ